MNIFRYSKAPFSMQNNNEGGTARGVSRLFRTRAMHHAAKEALTYHIITIPFWLMGMHIFNLLLTHAALVHSAFVPIAFLPPILQSIEHKKVNLISRI